ncbi:potassium channel family protein [Desulfogranum japonicum]|uniref:potassium channel family protein n=1 Tax=Desulfogranum japonicum TaxID=231447 RepID=UPI0012947EFC|nr:potassium channel family protein [Desulfogranum japonicum]
MKNNLYRLLRIVQRENIAQLVLFIIFMVFVGSLAITWAEPDISFVNGVWWSIVTLTTVGYGDISPTTVGGRVVAAFMMFFGIGILGMFSAALATIMISNRLKENKGMAATSLENHVIICEWNHRSHSVLKELRNGVKRCETPVVLIADIAEKPMDDPDLVFINGSANEETFGKANLKQASTVVILGDDNLDPTARDAKVVLTTLTVETINPDVYTIVEIIDKANKQHCLRANADEIIIGSELSSHLLATATMDHGMSSIVSELVSSRYGNDLYSVPLPENYVGTPFLELMVTVKEKYQATAIGIQKGREGDLMANPDHEYLIEEADRLVVIARKRFTF